MNVRLFDESLDKTRVIDILDQVLKEVNPGLSMNEGMFDGMIAVEGDQTILSRDSLVVEDDNGRVIGFTGLLKSSKRDYWRLEINVLPEYFESEYSVKLFEAILDLAKKQNAPDIRYRTRKVVFKDSLLEKYFKKVGLEPVHYNWWMRLDEIDSIPQPKAPDGITLHNQKELSDLASYLKVLNDAFRNEFDFRPYKEEGFKRVRVASWKEKFSEHWLASEGDKLIGFCSMMINPNQKHVGIIDILGVLHSYHRRGIGSFLLGSGIQTLIENGCDAIELGVETNNEKALNLYKKFGFNEVEPRTLLFYTIK